MKGEIKPADRLFEAHRSQLQAVGYRMLGTISEAEDVVQDGYIKWARHWHKQDRESIQNPRAFLISMVSRLCLDRLRRRRLERHHYVGPWLPEPLPTEVATETATEITTKDNPVDQIALLESINTGLLLILESLSPLERAVFTLYEAFDYSHAEIAALLDITLAHSRQLLHRARRTMGGKALDSNPGGEEVEPLVEAFYLAASQGDMQSLTRLLCDDVIAYSDGGGKASAALIPLQGKDRVITVFGHLIRRSAPNTSFRWQAVNGQRGLVIEENGVTQSVATFDLLDGRIHRMYVMRNPDKLSAFLS